MIAVTGAFRCQFDVVSIASIVNATRETGGENPSSAMVALGLPISSRPLCGTIYSQPGRPGSINAAYTLA